MRIFRMRFGGENLSKYDDCIDRSLAKVAAVAEVVETVEVTKIAEEVVEVA